jgi:LysM repeat protein
VTSPASQKPEAEKEKVEKTPMLAEEPIRKAIPVGKTWTYVVKKGDNLSRIARKTGASLTEIMELNKLKSDLIKIGQNLEIPNKSDFEKSEYSSTPPTGYTTYRVSKGDTLSKIARIYNTTAKKIAQLNGIENPNKISVGMELKVRTEDKQSEKQQKVSVETEGPMAKPFRTPVSGTDLAMLRDGENI